jgi:hypothetical protein
MRSALCGVALLLSGCGFNPLGAEIPNPPTVAKYVDETMVATQGQLTAGQYLVASISYTNEKCHDFFTNLAKVRQDSSFLQKVLSSAVATGSPVLALTETATTVGTASSLLSFASGVAGDASTVYILSDIKDELESLIFKEMGDVLRSKNLDQLGDYVTGLNLRRGERLDINLDRSIAFFNRTDPLAVMIARNIATDYAAKCTISNMKGAISRSIAKNNGSQTGGGGTILPSTSSVVSQDASVAVVVR